MIKYRPHRVTLKHSMEEMQTFKTIEELKEFLVARYDGAFDKSDIVIDKKQISDNRIDWGNERFLTVKRYGKTNYIELYGCPQCIGFVNLED